MDGWGGWGGWLGWRLEGGVGAAPAPEAAAAVRPASISTSRSSAPPHLAFEMAPYLVQARSEAMY